MFRARVRARVQEAEDAPNAATYAPNDAQADVPDIHQASHTAYATAVHLPVRGFLLWGQPFQGTLGWLLAAYNVFACILTGYDKFQAIRGGRRIPENMLFAIALTGGSLGILAGMLIFRHKTRHLSFRLGAPCNRAAASVAPKPLLLTSMLTIRSSLLPGNLHPVSAPADIPRRIGSVPRMTHTLREEAENRDTLLFPAPSGVSVPWRADGSKFQRTHL